MCIVFLSYNDSPEPHGYKLIIASNRDEFYARPTAPAEFWDKNPNIVGGIDLFQGKEGGTWLAISKDGKFGALTNYRQSPEFVSADAKGRGHLLTNYLLNNDKNTEEYLNEIQLAGHEYNGFNLLVGELSLGTESKVGCYCNQELKAVQMMLPGIHVLSNRTLNFPWPKAVYGREQFEEVIKTSQNKTELTSGLMKLLNERQRHFPGEDDSCFIGPQDSSNLEYENLRDACRAIFVKCNTVDYGTRTNTIILVDAQGHVTFTERTMADDATNPDDADWHISCHEFDIDKLQTLSCS